MRNLVRGISGALLIVLCVVTWSAHGQREAAVNEALRAAVPGVKVDSRSIGGVVLNANGNKPEAGVWVIAETKSLPAPFRKIVVTDDQGRFLVPDLPAGDYELWVRGYGLKDSERVKADCNESVKLQVANAATPQECRDSTGGGEDLSCQLLDVADSATPDERSSSQILESR